MANVALERERKLDVPEGFLLRELPGERLRTVTLVSAYFDTPDRRLAAAGITLRRRTQARRARWQLKLPDEEGRLEVEFAGRDEAPPAEVLDLLLAHLRGAELEPVATLRTRRQGRRLYRGEVPVADVFHDLVTVEGEADGRLEEVEIELLADGRPNDMRRIGKILARAGASPGDERPKVFRVLGIEAAPAIAADGPAPVRLGAMCSAQVRAMLAHDPGVRLGIDPEALHQFRVATRRLRALLRAARPALDRAWADGLRSELGWLAGETSASRDLDVLLDHLRPRAEALGGSDSEAAAELVDGLAQEQAASRERVLDALRSGRYLALLDRLCAEVGSPRLVEGGALDLDELAAAEYRRLRKAMRRIGDDESDEAVHRLRIKGKRARYAAELAARPGDRRGQKFIGAMKGFQDVLGEHQDAVVAADRLRALAAAAPAPVVMAAGRLIEGEAERRADARRALPKAWKAVARGAGRWPALG
ncbi:MAG TPA: CYTH and CHAD domain-containing protein [Gaiellales bacterium]|jgi:CHAD domain-containing protein|nr:CYTH and CHAD domain-containing protein [Gaiellales bacterium]